MEEARLLSESKLAARWAARRVNSRQKKITKGEWYNAYRGFQRRAEASRGEQRPGHGCAADSNMKKVVACFHLQVVGTLREYASVS